MKMKRKLMVGLMIAVILSGCGASKESTETAPVAQDKEIEEDTGESVETPSPEKIETEIQDEADDKTETATETEEELDEESKGKQITTKLFTVSIPDEWEDTVENVNDSTVGDGYALRFYDIASNETGYGGYLFGIELYPEGEDYSFYPEYEYFGKLTDNSANVYNVIIAEPADVQFTEETASQYSESLAGKKAVLDSFEVLEGCGFSETELQTDEMETAQAQEIGENPVQNSKGLPYIDYDISTVGESFSNYQKKSTLNFIPVDDMSFVYPYFISMADPDVVYYVTNSRKVYAVKDDIIVAFSEIIEGNRFGNEVLRSDCFYEVEPKRLYDAENVQAYGWQGNNGALVVSVLSVNRTPFYDAPVQVVSTYVSTKYCSLNTGDNY